MCIINPGVSGVGLKSNDCIPVFQGYMEAKYAALHSLLLTSNVSLSVG